MSRATRYDKELEQYRSLMEVPGTFEDGFSWTSLVGAVFIALVMVPGAMYMQLLAGYGIGPAAQWVTVILFIEVARRAQKTLKRAEVFVLFYMAGAVMAQPFSGLLWRQFFVQSNAATGMGIAETIPSWWAPNDRDVLATRSFFHVEWIAPLGLFMFQMVCGRLNTAILSYGLFRIASDMEKLPFPLAPVGAQGITALVEQQSEEGRRGADGQDEGNWRWRVFSIGGVLGLGFGAIYTALPALSTAILGKPITILPIPFVDTTQKTSQFLPAVPTGLSLNMGQLVIGMVLPFFAMLGSFLALLMKVIANPILHGVGMLPSWQTSDDTVKTQFHNYMDFYFSFGLGVALSIALVGGFQVVRSLRKKRAETRRQQALRREEAAGPPPGRGDIRFPWIIGTYLLTSGAYVVISGYLIDWHPGVMIVMLFFAYLYTPVISYVTARLEGMAGQMLTIPFVREAAFILSGYTGGVKVWFLPVPLADYGKRTVFYRQAELTGTKFWSIWKAELILVPVVLLSMVLFAQFIWGLAEIPSAEYPYADLMWELRAAQQSVIFSATLGRHSPFSEAFRPDYLLTGVGVGTGLFGFLRILGLPMMLAYGMIRGLNQMAIPHRIVTQFIGACLGRFYFERRMGLTWRKYVPVVAAGFACGMGLISVLGIGANFLARSVIKIPF